jgi:hypothetical protein
MLEMRIGMLSIRSGVIHLRNRLSPTIRVSVGEPGMKPRIRAGHVWIVGSGLLYRLGPRIGEFLRRKNVLLFGKLKWGPLSLWCDNFKLFTVGFHGMVS